MQLGRKASHSLQHGVGFTEPALSHTQSLPSRVPLSIRVKPSLLKQRPLAIPPPKIGLQSVCFDIDFDPNHDYAFATMEQIFAYETLNPDPEDLKPVDIEYMFPSPGSGIPILGFQCQINGNQLETKFDFRSNIDALSDDLTQRNITNIKMQTADPEESDDLVVLTIGSIKPEDVITIRVEFGITVPRILGSIYRMVIPVVLLPRVLEPRKITDRDDPRRKADFSLGDMVQNVNSAIRLGTSSNYTIDFNLTAQNFKNNPGRWELKFAGYDDKVEKFYSGNSLYANFSNLRAQSPNLDLDFDLEWNSSFNENSKGMSQIVSPSKILDMQSHLRVYAPNDQGAALQFPASAIAQVCFVSRDAQIKRLEDAQRIFSSNPNLNKSFDEGKKLVASHQTSIETSPGCYSQIFVLILDHSKFMKQTKLELLLNSTKTFLRMLPPTSWVSIAHIGLEFKWITSNPVICEHENIEELCDQIDDTFKSPSNSLGGLDLRLLPDAIQELDEIIESTRPDLNLLSRQLLLFSCGNMDSPESVCRQILLGINALQQPFRLSTVGIGGGSAYYLLRTLATFGLGVHEVVSDTSTIAKRFFYLLFRLTSASTPYPQIDLPAPVVQLETSLTGLADRLGVLTSEPYCLTLFQTSKTDPPIANYTLRVTSGPYVQTLEPAPSTAVSSSTANKQHRVNMGRLVHNQQVGLTRLLPEQPHSISLQELAISHRLLAAGVGMLAYIEPTESETALQEPFRTPIANQKIVVAGTVGQDYLQKTAKTSSTTATGLFSNARLNPSACMTGSVSSGTFDMLSEAHRQRIEAEAEKAKLSHPNKARPRQMLGSIAESALGVKQSIEFAELLALGSQQQSDSKKFKKGDGNAFCDYSLGSKSDSDDDLFGEPLARREEVTKSNIPICLTKLSLRKLAELLQQKTLNMSLIESSAKSSFGITSEDWRTLLKIVDPTMGYSELGIWLICHILDFLVFYLKGPVSSSSAQLQKLLSEAENSLHALREKFPNKQLLKVQIEVSQKLKVVKDIY